MTYTISVVVKDEGGNDVFTLHTGALPATEVIAEGYVTPGLASVVAALEKLNLA